ncbi:hypothetical protein D3C79_541920 [compost metagenome]
MGDGQGIGPGQRILIGPGPAEVGRAERPLEPGTAGRVKLGGVPGQILLLVVGKALSARIGVEDQVQLIAECHLAIP